MEVRRRQEGFEAPDRQLNVRNAVDEQELSPAAPSLSMMRHERQQQHQSLYPQQHLDSSLGISSFEGAVRNYRTTSHTVASSPVEVFSPPSVGQAMMEGSPFLRVASPLTPVSVSPNMFPSSPSSNLSSKHALGSEFEVSSAWGGTGLHQTAVGITSNAIKSESVLKSRCWMKCIELSDFVKMLKPGCSDTVGERSFVVEDGNDGSLQFRLHFEVKGFLHRKKIKIVKLMGGDCCDVFVFPVRRDGHPETVILPICM
jgi:hypothetical protein